MKHALLAAVAIAALAFPGLAATATKSTHATHAAHATRATAAAPVTKARKAVHQMLGAVPPFIRTGPKVGQGYVLRHRSPRPQSGRGFIAPGAAAPSSADNLTYNNSPDQIPPKAIATLPRVMHANTNYAIYWVPDGFRQASNYQTVVDQYFNDVAAGSYGNDNVDSPSVQYYDENGPIFYDASFGGSAVDSNPYPKGQCDKSMAAINASADSGGPDHLGVYHIHPLNEAVCLSDAQIEAEVKKFADSQGWAHGPDSEFFVFTAHNVGSCFYADGHVPKNPDGTGGTNVDNVCAYDYYCAYHSEFGNTPATEYIYANMPWPNQAYSFPAQGVSSPWKKSDCDAGEHPNGTGSVSNGTDPSGPTDADAADEVINVTSHEHQESVTDPTGYGWWDDNPDSAFAGYENGDLCAWYFPGRAYVDVSSNNSWYTNTLNGNHYFMQGEWSNGDATDVAGSGCMWGHTINTPEETGSSSISSSSGESTPTVGDVLTLTSGDWPAGTAIERVWLRCSPDASLAAIKMHAGHKLDGPGCILLQDHFTADNSAPTDTYTVTAKDVHQVIVPFVAAWNGTEPGIDAPSMFGIAIGGQPAATANPQLSYTGDLVPGTKLTADLGTWSPAATSLTVSWQRCQPENPASCKSFKTLTVKPAKTGATTTTYILTPADVRSAINVMVVGKNTLGSSDPANSGLTAGVAGYPTTTGDTDPSWSSDSPSVGTADVLSFGTWSTPPPVTGYTVTIKRCPVVVIVFPTPDMSSCETSTTLTATSTKTSVSYTPVAADSGDFLVGFLTAKNKNGTSDAVPVVAGIVDGLPAPDGETAPSVSPDTGAPGDTMDLNVGGWLNSPEQYRIIEYVCMDPTDTTSCSEWAVLSRLFAPDTFATVTAPDLSSYGITDYYLRFTVMAINANGFSDGVWGTAAEIITPPTS